MESKSGEPDWTTAPHRGSERCQRPGRGAMVPSLHKQLPWERIYTGDWHARHDRPHFVVSDQGLAHFQVGSALGQDPSPLLVQAPSTHRPRFLSPISRDLMISSPEPPTAGQVPFWRRRGSWRGWGQVGFYLSSLLLPSIPSPVSGTAGCNPTPAPAPRPPPPVTWPSSATRAP